MTGTDLEYVALNYANMIANATAALTPASAAAAARVMGLGAQAASTSVGCPERNVSVCPVTANALREENGQIEAVLFNPLARSRTEVVAIPVWETFRIHQHLRLPTNVRLSGYPRTASLASLGTGAGCDGRGCCIFDQCYQRASSK